MISATNVISHIYGVRKVSDGDDNCGGDGDGDGDGDGVVMELSRQHNVFLENDVRGSDTQARVEYLLGASDTPPNDRREMEHLGLGTHRTLQEYIEFAGIDLRNQTLTSRCESTYDWQQHIWKPALSQL